MTQGISQGLMGIGIGLRSTKLRNTMYVAGSLFMQHVLTLAFQFFHDDCVCSTQNEGEGS